MLRIESLWVEVNGKPVLKGVNLELGEGEVVALLGPNGSGKSSLLHAIMGNPNYRVVRGRIIFNGRDVTEASVDERARMGMGIAMQIPPRIRGIKLIDLLKKVAERYNTDFEQLMNLADKLRMDNLLNRDLHDGFSGGEMKRTEILLLAAQRPKLSLLDEPDSGVDIQSLSILGNAINEILTRSDDRTFEKSSGVIVTHMGEILKYIPSINRAFLMLDGQIKCFGHPQAILRDIERYGFEGCVHCISGVGDGS